MPSGVDDLAKKIGDEMIAAQEIENMNALAKYDAATIDAMFDKGATLAVEWVPYWSRRDLIDLGGFGGRERLMFNEFTGDMLAMNNAMWVCVACDMITNDTLFGGLSHQSESFDGVPVLTANGLPFAKAECTMRAWGDFVSSVVNSLAGKRLTSYANFAWASGVMSLSGTVSKLLKEVDDED